MSRYLVTVETVKIKDFIFSTNKLKLIRGASFLLDYLNQVKVPEILLKNGVSKDNIIYIGAGNAKFFVDTLDVAKNIAKEVKDIYKKEAPNSKVVVAFKEITFDGEKSQGKNRIWDDIDDLAKEVAIEKSKGFPIINIDIPYVEKCSLCGTNPVEVSTEKIREDLERLKISTDEIHKIREQIERLTQGKGRICEECLRKLIFSNLIKDDKHKIGFYGRLKDSEKGFGEDIDFDTEIEDYEGNKSFIGFMYSDGDGLGDFLKNISDEFKKKDSEKEYIEFLKEFSEKLDNNTKESLLEVLKKKFESIDKDKIKKEKIIGEFLIVGGDDVCAIFNPNLVLEISNDFQKVFEKKMKEYTEAKGIDKRITSSSGVVIAKSKTPIYHLFEQALKLQKNAKKKRYNGGVLKTGYIDFQVIGSEGCVDIKNFREKISKEKNQTIERPYSINKEERTETFESLIKIIREFKKEKFPKTKLRYIYELKRNDSMENFEKKMDFINYLSKMAGNHVALVNKITDVDYLNYNKFDNKFGNIFDILELYDFIDENEGGNNSED